MKRVLFATLLCVGLVGGCEDPSAPPPPPSADRTPSTSAPSTSPARPTTAAAPARDAEITAAAQRALAEDPSMSAAAQNCTITTEGGVATIKGVVSTQAEKDAIEDIVRAIPGVLRVDNQIEVKAP